MKFFKKRLHFLVYFNIEFQKTPLDRLTFEKATAFEILYLYLKQERKHSKMVVKKFQSVGLRRCKAVLDARIIIYNTKLWNKCTILLAKFIVLKNTKARKLSIQGQIQENRAVGESHRSNTKVLWLKTSVALVDITLSDTNILLLYSTRKYRYWLFHQ